MSPFESNANPSTFQTADCSMSMQGVGLGVAVLVGVSTRVAVLVGVGTDVAVPFIVALALSGILIVLDVLREREQRSWREDETGE